jgi:hypothetical protein
MAVDPLFHSGDALVVDIDMTQDVRSFIAARIVALVLRQESDAWQASGAMSRLSQTKPRFDDSRSRSSLASRPGRSAVSSSTASSTSINRRGSA